jgi:hypothetical protein
MDSTRGKASDTPNPKRSYVRPSATENTAAQARSELRVRAIPGDLDAKAMLSEIDRMLAQEEVGIKSVAS